MSQIDNLSIQAKLIRDISNLRAEVLKQTDQILFSLSGPSGGSSDSVLAIPGEKNSMRILPGKIKRSHLDLGQKDGHRTSMASSLSFKNEPATQISQSGGIASARNSLVGTAGNKIDLPRVTKAKFQPRRLSWHPASTINGNAKGFNDLDEEQMDRIKEMSTDMPINNSEKSSEDIDYSCDDEAPSQSRSIFESVQIMVSDEDNELEIGQKITIPTAKIGKNLEQLKIIQENVSAAPKNISVPIVEDLIDFKTLFFLIPVMFLTEKGEV
ncbi:hypothetical protein HK100_003001 [Physocladia obscura]|uniref:Uncharacterized protein n=1 Tax=Physocladia obscura TaxID=109957 RepID=A0AAD5SUJ9_9FUNG|nr:hypothetical protein HK100_003001 [Physocladia obscura]